MTPETPPSSETPVEVPGETPPKEVPGETPVEAPAEAATEEYELELSDASPISAEEFDAIVQKATDLGLNKEQAEYLISQSEAAHNKAAKSFEEKRNNEIKEAKAALLKDPEFVGDKAAASWDSVSRAVQEYGSPEFQQLLTQPGFGDNVHLARFLKGIGDKIKPEGTPPGQGVLTPGGQEKNTGKAWYPSFYKEK